MSTDATVTKELIETLEDGRNGFEKATERIASTDAAHLASTFERFAQQRAQFSAELRQLAASWGENVDSDGTVAAKVHRGWLTVKDALSGSDAKGVLSAAETGEDHTVSEYEKALKDDISPALRAVVERQFTDVRAAHDEIKRLRDAHK